MARLRRVPLTRRASALKSSHSSFLRKLTGIFGLVLLSASAFAQRPKVLAPHRSTSPRIQPTIVVRWNQVSLEAVRASRLGPPMVARALAIIHTCIYDAWAAYDPKAHGTLLGSKLRQPISERTRANKEKAISYAAYGALVDLFPAYRYALFENRMLELGYDPTIMTTDSSSPEGIGRLACDAVLNNRHLTARTN